MDNTEIYLQAIRKWGRDLQILTAIEELSELIKELAIYKRDKFNIVNLIDEIADVEIMIAQIKYIFGIWDNVLFRRTKKLLKLQEKLNE